MEHTCNKNCIVRLALTSQNNVGSEFTVGVILAGTTENFEDMIRVHILAHILDSTHTCTLFEDKHIMLWYDKLGYFLFCLMHPLQGN